MSDRKENFTPGPWGWFGTTRSGYYLATKHSGRRYVMDFVRKGFNNAEPRFQPGTHGMVRATELAIFEVCSEAESDDDPRVYRRDIIGFRCADAALIAAAPELYAALEKAAEALDKLSVGDDNLITVAPILAARAALSKARGEK